MSVDLEQALARAERLPTPPEVATNVLDLARDEDVDLNRIADAISRDPALTSRLLKVANSPLFGGSRNVASIREALMILGLRSVKVMVLGFSLVQKPREPDGFDYESFWYTALVSAVAGKVLARRFAPRLTDEAFVGGLLLDIGMLAAKEAWTEEYAVVLERMQCSRESLVPLEREVLGTDHMQVGSFLMRSWGLPERLCLVVEHHHEPEHVPDDAPPGTTELAHLLQAAAALGQTFRCEIYEGADEAFVAELRLVYAHLSKGSEELPDFEDLLREVREGLQDAVCTFELDPANPDRLLEIQDAAAELLMQISLGTALDLRHAHREADDEEARATRLEEDNQRLEQQARSDGLTGLANRGELERRLERILLDSDGAPLGLMMLDLDHFKSVNDDHGHAAGDEVLRRVGRILVTDSGDRELDARYGGEEFCVVLPGADRASVERRAEEIRAAVERLRVPLESGAILRPTVSIGVCWTPSLDARCTSEELQRHADSSLYESKRAGRNRVTAAPFDPTIAR